MAPRGTHKRDIKVKQESKVDYKVKEMAATKAELSSELKAEKLKVQELENEIKLLRESIKNDKESQNELLLEKEKSEKLEAEAKCLREELDAEKKRKKNSAVVAGVGSNHGFHGWEEPAKKKQELENGIKEKKDGSMDSLKLAADDDEHEESDFKVNSKHLADIANEKVKEELARIEKYVKREVKKTKMKMGQVDISNVQQYSIRNYVFAIMEAGFSDHYRATRKLTCQRAKRGLDTNKEPMKPMDVRLIIKLAQETWGATKLPQFNNKYIEAAVRPAITALFNKYSRQKKNKIN